jgi:hypothetical protein
LAKLNWTEVVEQTHCRPRGYDNYRTKFLK